MADQQLVDLTEETSPVSTDMLYMVGDPSGTAVDRKVEVGNLVGAGDTGSNLIKNSPGQIVTDGVEPQWWDDSGSATLTDEDAAGEGIPDKTERVFKCVTVGDDHYGYQTLTFADEELLDAGVTVVSFSCLVYCTSANMASIGLYGTNLGLQESSQAGAGAWELLTVENITLNAADTALEVRLIVDTGTAYFALPMVNLGSRALTWTPRGKKFVPRSSISQYDLNTTGDVAWSDTDCTANTDPLALAIYGQVTVVEADGVVGSYHDVGHYTTLIGGDSSTTKENNNVLGPWWVGAPAKIACNDSQVVRYRVTEQDADNDVRAIFDLKGYWVWA